MNGHTTERIGVLERCVTGLLSDLERKNCDTIAAGEGLADNALERPLPGEQGETRYYYSNLPADARWSGWWGLPMLAG